MACFEIQLRKVRISRWRLYRAYNKTATLKILWLDSAPRGGLVRPRSGSPFGQLEMYMKLWSVSNFLSGKPRHTRPRKNGRVKAHHFQNEILQGRTNVTTRAIEVMIDDLPGDRQAGRGKNYRRILGNVCRATFGKITAYMREYNGTARL